MAVGRGQAWLWASGSASLLCCGAARLAHPSCSSHPGQASQARPGSEGSLSADSNDGFPPRTWVGPPPQHVLVVSRVALDKLPNTDEQRRQCRLTRSSHTGHRPS